MWIDGHAGGETEMRKLTDAVMLLSVSTAPRKDTLQTTVGLHLGRNVTIKHL